MAQGNLSEIKLFKRFENYPRGKHFSTIVNFCERPLRSVTINNNGDCFLCICDAWLPISVGNIESFKTLDEIWSNPMAREIQQDIADKKYTHCAVEHCGILYQNIEQPTYLLNVALDTSCNLACPTCRREMINFTSGSVYEERLKRVNHFLNLLENFDKPLSIILIGNGDPLASSIMRPLILNWKPAYNQKIILFTNGLLMKKLLPDSTILSNISEFQISVDAGSKEVYEQVRRPGKYETLRENLDWLAKNKPQNSKVKLKFTLSTTNAGDIENFSNMCAHYRFNGEITKLDDWGTFDDFFNQEVIDNIEHPRHELAIQQIKSVSTHSHIWLSPYFKKFL
jgi:molybdenum cofactor biosynthesis enzyme MoaA